MTYAILIGFIPLLLTVLCILLAWWCLQEFRFDLFLKRPLSPQGKLLRVLIAVVLGYQFAKFILDYLEWSSVFQIRWAMEQWF